MITKAQDIFSELGNRVHGRIIVNSLNKTPNAKIFGISIAGNSLLLNVENAKGKLVYNFPLRTKASLATDGSDDIEIDGHEFTFPGKWTISY